MLENHTSRTDANQLALKAPVALPLERMSSNPSSQPTAVFVSDSSLRSGAFVYGMQLVLQSFGVRLLWVCVRFGATAATLKEFSSKAPLSDDGVTLCNGKDFTDKSQPCGFGFVSGLAGGGRAR